MSSGGWGLARLPAVLAAMSVWAQPLAVRLEGDYLRVSASPLGILRGQALERLHNGAPAAFAFQLTAAADRQAGYLLRDVQRFIFSYDLWEEKFAVMRLGHPRRSISHLSAPLAEAWCVDQMSLKTGSLAAGQPFWVRLEVRFEAHREEVAEEEAGVSLARLIELFSRRSRRQEGARVLEVGPLRLEQLRNSPARSTGAK